MRTVTRCFLIADSGCSGYIAFAIHTGVGRCCWTKAITSIRKFLWSHHVSGSYPCHCIPHTCPQGNSATAKARNHWLPHPLPGQGMGRHAHRVSPKYPGYSPKFLTFFALFLSLHRSRRWERFNVQEEPCKERQTPPGWSNHQIRLWLQLGLQSSLLAWAVLLLDCIDWPLEREKLRIRWFCSTLSDLY